MIDLNRAVEFGLLVKAAEDILPASTANEAGRIIQSQLGGVDTPLTVLTSVFANDLATDINPQRGNLIVSFGLILQTPNHDIVVVLRGTQGVWEWAHDAEFLLVKCPFLSDGGQTEDGFTAIYNSLRVDTNPDSSTAVEALADLAAKGQISSVTLCGHSLGAAIATLLALDLAANTKLNNAAVYTYASPRTGDPDFARAYNQKVPNTFRVANRLDLVPNLPLPPVYEHVSQPFELNPMQFTPVPIPLVKLELACEHQMSTYLHLLSVLAGGTIVPLDPACEP